MSVTMIDYVFFVLVLVLQLAVTGTCLVVKKNMKNDEFSTTAQQKIDSTFNDL